MEQLKLQMRPNATARAQKNATRSNLVVLILLATVIAAFFLLLVLVCNSRNSMRRGKKYGIVIDGGSTGTRIHVFGFELDGGGRPVFDFGKKGLGSMRVSPGLSSYAEDPNRSGGSLVELLEFGKSREAILESCRRVLRVSGFQFRDSWASVITGSDEGIYAWVVANHALGSLGGDPRETTGIIELGGASAQVTFVSSEPVPPEFSHTLRFGNVTYNLYSHSLLDFGQNVALESLQKSLYSTDLMG
ncbi:putative apyrase 4 [Vitis vinifera]|uniref:Putative apyrase 4 n=1 Tax=Vitis vinifera TaxID=29760 RepID=A0A438G7N5_VITVI|nr:putative apyrase 4 [Vitis vinifera]